MRAVPPAHLGVSVSSLAYRAGLGDGFPGETPLPRSPCHPWRLGNGAGPCPAPRDAPRPAASRAVLRQAAGHRHRVVATSPSTR
jgi:hypothetical protein